MKTKSAAKLLQSMGQGDDTILAHITPEEAAVLKAGGGSGKRNPKTGLLAFGGYEGGGTDMSGGYEGGLEANDLAQFGLAPALAGLTDAQDARNLLSFDRSQPAPLDPMTASLIGFFGGGMGKLGVGAYNAFDSTRAANNSGAGYGSGWGYFGDGNQMATADVNYGDGYGAGGVAGAVGGGGLLSAPTVAAPIEPTYTQPAFVSKWGKPRSGFTDPYARNRRGLLGG